VTKLMGIALLLVGLSGLAIAGVPIVPEIDYASGVGALALLSGAILVIRARKK
jgi:hypothetical protein